MVSRDAGIKAAIKYLKKKKIYNKIRYTKAKDLVKLEKIIDSAVKLNKGVKYKYN